MADEILAVAIKRREEIDSTIHKLRSEAAELDVYIRTHQRLKATYFPESYDVVAEVSESESGQENIDATKPIPTPKAELVAAAIQLIKEKGRPYPLSELCDALESKGIVIGGNDPRANLSAKLGQSDELISIRGLGWWIKSIPFNNADPKVDIYVHPRVQSPLERLLLKAHEARMKSED